MNRYLIRKVLFPAYRAMKRDGVLAYLAEMHRVEKMDPEAIREFQWKKFKHLLEYSAKHVPYYRDVFDHTSMNHKAGLGLVSMEERARLVNGEFSIESKPGQGTVVKLRVPLSGRDT